MDYIRWQSIGAHQWLGPLFCAQHTAATTGQTISPQKWPVVDHYHRSTRLQVYTGNHLLALRAHQAICLEDSVGQIAPTTLTFLQHFSVLERSFSPPSGNSRGYKKTLKDCLERFGYDVFVG